MLPANDNSRCKAGQTPDNKLKNRFLNIYPCEYNLNYKWKYIQQCFLKKFDKLAIGKYFNIYGRE